MKYDPQTHRLTDTGAFQKRALIIGIAALLLSAIGLFTNAEQFYFSYLTAFIYWFTIAIGGLFFTLLGHITGAVWSIVLRRIAEALGLLLLPLAILFIPILFGMHELFHWSNAEAVAHDALLQKKAGYLNLPFFIIRAVFYFTLWFFLTRILYKNSLQQDRATDGTALAEKLRRISAPGTILFALTLTFASFDWVMSIDAHWFSTMFGVYIFSGSYLVVIAFLIILLQYFRRQRILINVVTGEHFHDLGRLLYTFVIFWAYIAGAQYFLIWYANIPEETVWYLHRWQGSWKYVSLFIIAFHFVIPFFTLLFRAAKRNQLLLGIMAGLILVMHWFDLYWLIMPSLHRHNAHFSWLDVTTLVGIGGVFISLLIRQLARQPVVSVGDPRLRDSIDLVNH
ncbi:MAG: hypothetical protein H8E14_08725 [Candidatus Marinimicrobia bacterium]|nr:hypothetical protein [Candidatus Neomarinimicrobiota bacterium]